MITHRGTANLTDNFCNVFCCLAWSSKRSTLSGLTFGLINQTSMHQKRKHLVPSPLYISAWTKERDAETDVQTLFAHEALLVRCNQDTYLTSVPSSRRLVPQGLVNLLNNRAGKRSIFLSPWTQLLTLSFTIPWTFPDNWSICCSNRTMESWVVCW